VIEAVSSKSLRQYCQDEIFAPLGMSDTDFECEGARRERLVGVQARGKNGKLEVSSLDPPSHPEVYGGGYGAYSTARDYARFLRMIMNNGGLDGVRILRPETVHYMLQNHTGDMEMTSLITVIPSVSADAEFFPRLKKSHSLAMMRNEDAVPGTLSEASHFWAGALNTYFWIDPARDVAGIILMQHLPFCDPAAINALVDFQKAVYACL
jgi:CubicO group peptidase (beta-lactamase class C family)